MNHRLTIIRAALCACALFLLILTTAGKATAEICWGKVCDASVCCYGHGDCTSFNVCTCDIGYIGKECGTISFCGVGACSADCSGQGVCVAAPTSTSLTGTCSATGVSLTCTASNAIKASCSGTGAPTSSGTSVTCTLNSVSGICTYSSGVGTTASPYICYWEGLYSVIGSAGSCYCNDGYGGACCGTFMATLAPAALDFGTVSVGATAGAATPVTFTNPLSASALTLGTITVGGTNSGDFSLGSGTCAAAGSVAAAGSCTVPVTFTPIAAGARSATLTVTTTSPAATLTTALSGTGTIVADSIVIDPAVATTLYAGLNGAGIYKSLDNGATWTAATTQPTNRRIKAVVINASDTTKLYAATYGGGVFASTDSGVTWAACTNTNLANRNLVSLVMDANGKLYAGTEAGVFASTDACATWAAASTGLP